MVNTATFTSSAFSTDNQYIKYKIIIKENSVDETANKRNVTVSVFVYRTNTGYTTYGTGTVYCTINGTQYSSTISSSQKITDAGITLFSKTLDIAFNADGTKTLATSAYIKHSRFSSTSHSFSPTLTPIPRASTVSASNGTLGTAQAITVTRASTSFTHTVTYSCGSASGTIGTAKTTATSLSWTPPLSLASQNTSGTEVNATIKCDTYSGNTLIGSKSVSVKLAIPATVIPDAVLTVTDEEGFYSDFGVFVKGKSRFNVSVQTTPAYGAAISKISINANGAVYKSSPAITDIILNSGSQKITATVTDSRGRSKTVSQTVNVIDYSAPQITSLEPRRCDEDGTPNEQGLFVKITYAFVATSLNNQNLITLVLQYKKSADTTWNSQTLINQQAVYSATTDIIIPADDDSSYDIKLRIKDLLSDFIDTDTSASTGFTILTIGASGKVVSFSKLPEVPSGTEFGDKAYFYDEVHLNGEVINDFISEIGETDGYKYRKSNSGLIELWGDVEVTFPASTEISGVNRSVVTIDLSDYLSKIIDGKSLIQDSGRLPIFCRNGGNPTIAELIIISPTAFPQKTLTVPVYVMGEI